MIKEFKIESLEKKTANTKYGEKEQWLVNGKGTAFIGNWNADWKVGDTVKADVIENEYNGKIYVNLNCPPELKQSRGMQYAIDPEEIKMIHSKINRIISWIEGRPYPTDTKVIPNDPAITQEDIQEIDKPF